MGRARQTEDNPDGLTVKQRRFILAFCGEANGNATEAARITGYACPNVQGAQNLANPRIRAAVDRHLSEKALASNEVLARLADMARASIADVATVDEESGTIRFDWRRARREGKLHLIAELAFTEAGPKVKLHDAQAALVQLGRYHGLFKDRHVVEFDPVEAAESLDHKLVRFAARVGANGVPGVPDPD